LFLESVSYIAYNIYPRQLVTVFFFRTAKASPIVLCCAEWQLIGVIHSSVSHRKPLLRPRRRPAGSRHPCYRVCMCIYHPCFPLLRQVRTYKQVRIKTGNQECDGVLFALTVPLPSKSSIISSFRHIMGISPCFITFLSFSFRPNYCQNGKLSTDMVSSSGRLEGNPIVRRP